MTTLGKFYLLFKFTYEHFIFVEIDLNYAIFSERRSNSRKRNRVIMKNIDFERENDRYWGYINQVRIFLIKLIKSFPYIIMQPNLCYSEF